MAGYKTPNPSPPTPHPPVTYFYGSIVPSTPSDIHIDPPPHIVHVLHKIADKSLKNKKNSSENKYD